MDEVQYEHIQLDISYTIASSSQLNTTFRNINSLHVNVHFVNLCVLDIGGAETISYIAVGIISVPCLGYFLAFQAFTTSSPLHPLK